MRTCEEDVELAKCEGSCVSSTQPSAMERSCNEAIGDSGVALAK